MLRFRHTFLELTCWLLLVALAGSCTRLPDNSARSESHAIHGGSETTLGESFAADIAAHPGQAGVLLLGHGRDAFVARAALAQLSERSVDVQYYMFHHDTVGNLLIHELVEAADRNVRVRLLIDDMYGNDGEDDWVALDAHPYIEVRFFNPFARGTSRYLQYITRFRDIDYRMHAKSYTVDNQVTIVGGRNIGDEYFDADPKLAFSDLDALAVGPVAQRVSAEFDAYWNSEYAYPAATLIRQGVKEELDQLRSRKKAFYHESSTSVYLRALQDSPLARSLREKALELRWGDYEIIHDSPEKRTRDADRKDELLISQLAPYITGATREVIIVSPYFVPGQPATDALCKLSQDGVRVRILTNSLASNDVSAVHAGYSKYRKPLLRCGVQLFELDEQIRADERRTFTWLPGLSKSSLHAKTMAFDRELLFVGSFNFDQRSLHINNEIGLLFREAKMASRSTDKFDQHIEEFAFAVTLERDDDGEESLRWISRKEGKERTFDSEPFAGAWLKAKAALLRCLPIESEL
jgi:putative cardiolipin synthase